MVFNDLIDFKKYEDIDNVLLEVSKKLKPLYHVEPLNEKEQKELFFCTWKNPEFIYRGIEYNVEEVESKIKNISFPDPESFVEESFNKIFQTKKANVFLENEIIKKRGTELVKVYTSNFHGVPSEELLNYAKKILKENSSEELPKIVSANAIKENLEQELFDLGLTNWKVELSDKKLTTVYPSEKRMTVCKSRFFTENDVERLKVHEIGVHIIRGVNGYLQPLNVFGTGLPGYLSTEEGLTSYFEELTGTTDVETLKDYAGRVIAVDSVVKNFDFKNTFDRLKSFDLSNEKAWNLSVRAHRGGGYVKDHVYLQGLQEIKDYVSRRGDLKLLFLGKIGLKDVALSDYLLQKNILVPPKYLPKILK